jgi:hypothetical protein
MLMIPGVAVLREIPTIKAAPVRPENSRNLRLEILLFIKKNV